MGRAARRAQERLDRRQQTQQRIAPARAPRISVSGPVVEERTGAAVWKPWTWRWVADIVSELRKVTWPSRSETNNLTMVVILVSALVAVLLGGADIGFNWLVERTLLP
ncbi:MAG: preprotein translocase subunit SecE [Dehalococcoidia bacterium]